MNFLKLTKNSTPVLSVADIAKILSIDKKSAYVTANRYVKRGLLVRLKRDFYVATSNINSLKEDELFEIANILQVPSYVSLGSALSYYELTTQQPRYFVESVGLKRTISFEAERLNFTYTKFKREFYFDFVKKENFFIALPEKALADIIYLVSMHKYGFDFSSLNFKKIDKEKVECALLKANHKAVKYWKGLCSTYKI